MTNNSHTTGILCENLVFSYGKRTILDNLSFSVQTGDFCVLTGESGSGKTTLLQCVGALESPSAGEITVKGNPVTKLRGKQKREFLRNTVGFVFQNAGVVASWTVQKNLEVGGKRVRDNLEETTSALTHFGLDTSVLDRKVYQLSGGQQQRVALIRAAIQKPEVLLMDEPTSALDDLNAERVASFIDSLCADGVTVLTATHDARLIKHAQQQIHLS